MRILALDAATESCSAALWLDGALQVREARAERGHGAHVLQLIDALLADAGVALGTLDALAFGRGPGAFTGVRLAASITQGLAYSSGLPVLPVSDLRAVAQRTLMVAPTCESVLVGLDARLGEVYWAGFERRAGLAQAATAEGVDRPARMIERAGSWLGNGDVAAGAGSGFALYPQLAASLAARLGSLWPDLAPHAREIAVLAAHDGLAAAVPAELALPVYVRNDVAVVPGAAARPS